MEEIHILLECALGSKFLEAFKASSVGKLSKVWLTYPGAGLCHSKWREGNIKTLMV